MSGIENAVLSESVGASHSEDIGKQAVPPQILTLPQNFFWTLAGNVTYMGCQWGMLVALARLGNPEMLGRFALAFALTAPIFQFSGLQLRGLQATDARGEYSFGEYLGLRWLTVVLSGVAAAGICLAGGYRGEVLLVTILVAAAKGFEAISDVYYGRMQLKERMDKISRSMIIKGGISLAGLALGVGLTGSLVYGVALLAISWLAVLMFYDIPQGRALTAADSLPICFRTERLWSLARLGLPMGVVMLLLSLEANVPRYFVEWKLGEGALGIFAALAALMVAGNAVVNALGQSALPRLAVYAASERRQDFRKLAGRLVGVGIGLGLATMGVAWAAGRPLLSLVYGAEYAAHNETFLWLMGATAVSYCSSFLGVALTALRIFQLQMFLQIGSVALCAILSVMLVGRYGLPGAGIALLGTMAFDLFGRAAILAIASWRSRPAWD